MKTRKRMLFAIGLACALNANAQLSTPTGTVSTSTTGNYGVGLTDPTGFLHIKAPSVAQEVILKASVTDAPNDFLNIQNSTSGSGQFIPMIWGHNQTAPNQYARGLSLIGSVNSTLDVYDGGINGGNSVVQIDARQYNAGVHSKVLNRNLFTVTNLNVPAMIVAASGKVGIGMQPCMPADGVLGVNGTIYATGVKVKLLAGSCFPDYVFEKDYKLMPLGELDTYIKANKHLPGIPKASVVEAEGMDLAQLELKLVEKVEELTLYMIEMEKKMKAVESENENLKRSIESLR